MENLYNKLTPEEKDVIDNKGTEKPFSGRYNKHMDEGLYICKRCGVELYRSDDKFDSGCGWPSFDDEILGSVKRTPDKDGNRTEITCINCNAHLGHIFTGEKLTNKNIRHCVNSISMIFIPSEFKDSEKHTAFIGGGCFWCLEALYSQIIGVKEIISGYSGGYKNNPSYEEVGVGNTGHAEVVKIVFDYSKISYRQILEVFFAIHNPTTVNQQGNDIGSQYKSIILYSTLKQKMEAETIIEDLTKNEVFDKPIVTELRPFIKFYPAEDYHQDYYIKNPEKAYCQAVISPKLSILREKYKYLLKK
jgi:peptide methionine sulfoxide reductase msrA/msrB